MTGIVRKRVAPLLLAAALVVFTSACQNRIEPDNSDWMDTGQNLDANANAR